MSRENVELLRVGYRAFGAGDMEAILGLLSGDVRVDVHTERIDRGSDVYRGHDGFLANLRELTDVFDDFKIEPEEIVDRGERVLVIGMITGRGKVSGAGIETRIFHVWTISEGRAVRLEIFSDRDHAQAALDAGTVRD